MRKRGVLVELRPSAGVRSYLGAAFATMSSRPAADPASWKPRIAVRPRPMRPPLDSISDFQWSSSPTPIRHLISPFNFTISRCANCISQCNALVVFPGGFGTLDELFELLTLMQTHKMPPIPVVLVDQLYWTRVINFRTLVDEGMIAPADLDLFSYVENAEE